MARRKKGSRKKHGKRRSAAQRAATRKLVALNRKKGGKKRKGKKRRTAAQKRATRKMVAANRKRKGGARKGPKSSGGGSFGGKSAIQGAYRKLIDRGASEEYARKVVARLERRRLGNIRKGVASEDAKHKAAANAAHWADFGSIFGHAGRDQAKRNKEWGRG